ncbi:MAG: molybdopterin-dependent oxidoreductase, partial [Calditrichota bacterium]
IVADMFMTDTAKIADIVFPIVPFTESAGTVTNGEGRIQYLNNVIKPLTGMPNWRIIIELMQKLSETPGFQSVNEVTDEILEIVPEYKKEFAVFRNGYIPRTEILVDARSLNLPYGANYLEKWFDLFRTRTYANDVKKNEKIISPQEAV